MCPPPTEPRKQPQPQPAGPLCSSRSAGHRGGGDGAGAAPVLTPSPRGAGLAPLQRPASVPHLGPRRASRPGSILPPVCLAFPVCGAGCPESVPRGGGGEPCGPSPAHGGLDKAESRLPGFVWDLSGSPRGKRDTVLPSLFRGSPSPPRWWQGARAAPAVRRAQLPAWLQSAACSSGAGKSPSHAIVRLLFDRSDS
ncbi:unnamed protein product [Coccothraustes coccothraustes]